ncbi:hypothetical protein JXA02_09675 [candidate division KSB1 bacterium]|nr:hypothetical protein [candidate division KSB1 bacterium]RQW04249.1 MAG: hypothetical protein EH222_11460 [candidate division KSB1 bacterium]
MAKITRHLLIAFSLLTLDIFAQGDIVVDSHVDRNKILIGDVIHYSVIVTRDKNLELLMPSTAENLGMFEIRDYAVREPRIVDDQIVEQVDYEISTFDTGDYLIPEVAIQYRAQGDSSWQTLMTEPHDIVVESLNPDEAGDIRDIKPPMTPPRDYARLIKSVISGVLLLAVILFVLYYLKRRREGKSLIPMRGKPPRPAHEIALEALQRLRESDLLSSGKVKEFYTELSDIVRQYVEGRFYMPAMEMTTTQLVNVMREQNLPDKDIEKLNALLARSDLVKFAKLEPPADENTASLQLATDYVNETKLVFDPVDDVSITEAVYEEKTDV